MSHLTRRVLTLLDPAPIAERRRANYAFYAESLGDIAFYPDGIGDAVPFAFPIRCDDAGDVATRLWSEGIFAARYWPTLGSPPAAFPAEHRLANQMVALPCDQRYTPRELVRVARAVRSAM